MLLFLLSLADVLVHVNKILRFLQSRSLIYTTIPRKLPQLTINLEKLRNEASFRFRKEDRNCHDRPVNMATELM